MWSSFLYSINTVLPILITVVLGKLFSKTKLLSDSFFEASEKFVFKIALPAMLFLEVSKADPKTLFDGKYILFCVLGVFFSFLIPCLTVPLFVKDDAQRGAFIQGVYRSNFAILGISLADNMFGESGTQQIAVLMPFAVIMFNVFATLILSIYSPKEENISKGQVIKGIVRNTATNPLILSLVIAIPFMLLEIPIPAFADKSISYLSATATPLALMSLGASFRFESAKEKFKLAISASLLKTVVLPLIMVGIAVLCGYRNEQLGCVFILFGGPAAVSSFIMAKNMKSDHELAAQILLITTVLCSFTMFVGIFVMKSTGLI